VGRPLRGGSLEGERRWCEETKARLDDDERETRRCRFDDPGARPSHAPPMDAGGDFEDIRRRLEAVL
jgi:hypothetical protein